MIAEAKTLRMAPGPLPSLFLAPSLTLGGQRRALPAFLIFLKTFQGIQIFFLQDHRIVGVGKGMWMSPAEAGFLK